MIVSVFTPHGGCPERCAFCDQSVSGGKPTSKKQVASLIDKHLETAADSQPVEVAFYGGTFTAMPKERQVQYLEAVQPYLAARKVSAVRISTRPDALDAEWLLELRDKYAVETVEIGVQSFNPEVLFLLGRSHAPEEAEKGVELLHSLGFKAGVHLLIGAPGEGATDTEDEFTIEKIRALRPEFVRLHPLLVLKGTELEKLWRSGAFQPISLEQAVERLANLVPAIEKAGAKVIRIGLQANELLGQSVLAGPYHPSIGDLARGRILRNEVFGELIEQKIKSGDSVDLEVPEKIAGTLKGRKSENLLWLKKHFDLSSLTVKILKGVPIEKQHVKVRVRHADRPAKRRQIESAQ